MESASLLLGNGDLLAKLLPAQGAVIESLTKDGFSILARTPWSSDLQLNRAVPSQESDWVKNWLGGWQLCAPSVGQPHPKATIQAFHGEASQAPWRLVAHDSNSASLEWTDSARQFQLTRRWSLPSSDALMVEATITNISEVELRYELAEHLILGSDFLQPCLVGHNINLRYPQDARVLTLDYSAAPDGGEFLASDLDADWRILNHSQPARVFALTSLDSSTIFAEVGQWRVQVTWTDLPSVIIWQELATTVEAPWNNQVLALGIEPTTSPHGLGTNAPSGPTLHPKETRSWSTTVKFEKLPERT
jgi:galactose mutarotase-like enzyme